MFNYRLLKLLTATSLLSGLLSFSTGSCRDPEQADRLLVKRVAALPGERSPEGSIVPRGRVYLVGDDPATSRDSRAFGTVALDGLLGLAWYRYAPPGRVGPLIGSRRA